MTAMRGMLAFALLFAASLAAAEEAPQGAAAEVMPGARAAWLGPEDAQTAVLFIHGFMGAGDNFSTLPAQAAALGLRVRVMRLPGHGTRPRELATTTAEELLAAVREEVKALRQEHDCVVLVGHSMGGALAALAAVEQPVDGLVLAAPYFGVTDRWYYGLQPERWAGLTAPVLRWIYRPMVSRPVNRKEARQAFTAYKWMPAKAGLQAVRVSKAARKPEHLERIAAPVLLLHGQQDRTTDPDAAMHAVEAMASEEKQVVLLKRSNHMLFHDYDREEAMEAALAFLQARAEACDGQTD